MKTYQELTFVTEQGGDLNLLKAADFADEAEKNKPKQRRY